MGNNTTYRIAISLEMVAIILLMLFFAGLVLGLVTRTLDDSKELKRNRLSLERTLERE